MGKCTDKVKLLAGLAINSQLAHNGFMKTATVKATCPEFPFFGASYPDACCIDGYLWDLDSCEIPGGPLYHGGDEPCPFCNYAETVERVAETLWSSGDFTRKAADREARRRIKAFVAKHR